MGYVDDYGSLSPSGRENEAEETIDIFATSLVILMNGDERKKERKKEGSLCDFPRPPRGLPLPQSGVKLRISLPDDKTRTWIYMLKRLIALGVAADQELQSVVGRLSFAQTCIFGKMGRAMLSPFYEKMKAPLLHSFTGWAGAQFPTLAGCRPGSPPAPDGQTLPEIT